MKTMKKLCVLIAALVCVGEVQSVYAGSSGTWTPLLHPELRKLRFSSQNWLMPAAPGLVRMRVRPIRADLPRELSTGNRSTLIV